MRHPGSRPQHTLSPPLTDGGERESEIDRESERGRGERRGGRTCRILTRLGSIPHPVRPAPPPRQACEEKRAQALDLHLLASLSELSGSRGAAELSLQAAEDAARGRRGMTRPNPTKEPHRLAKSQGGLAESRVSLQGPAILAGRGGMTSVTL